MLNKKVKQSISVIAFTFFIGTSFNFPLAESANAAPLPPPPIQGQIKPPPPKPVHPTRPSVKPAPKPNISRPMPKPARPNVKPRPTRPSSTVRPAPRPNISRPIPRPARPNVKPRPTRPNSTVKPTPKPNITKPMPRPGSNFKPVQKPHIKRPINSNSGIKVKPPRQEMSKPRPGSNIRPPRKPNEHMRPPIKPFRGGIDKNRPLHGNKKPLLKKPHTDKLKPIRHKNPAFRPNHNRPRPPMPPKHDRPPKPHYKFKLHDRFVPPPPPIYHRAPRWLLFTGGFVYPYHSTTVVNHVITDYSYLDTANDGVYLDNFVKTKYVEGSYDGQDYYADYYLDKNSLEVLQYNPPNYIIRVNEVSFDNENADSPYITTWEFKYNLDYHTVYFRNVYDPYQIDPKDWTFLNVYDDEYYLMPTAEMAFYLAYKYRFFDNQPDEFYDVTTL